MVVIAVSVQGQYLYSNWVKTYELKYNSDAGNSFQTILDVTGAAVVSWITYWQLIKIYFKATSASSFCFHFGILGFKGLSTPVITKQWTWCNMQSYFSLTLQQFKGSTSQNKIEKTKLDHPITARYIQLLPKICNEYCCMRVELHGCDIL